MMERSKENLHIYKTQNNKYSIQKYKNGKLTNWGTYESIEEARRVRDHLRATGWDLNESKVKRRGKQNKNRYITQKAGKYLIVKHNPETMKPDTYETGIRSIEEARELRDWWEQHNWNWDAI